jgi:hypothetical protein
MRRAGIIFSRIYAASACWTERGRKMIRGNRRPWLGGAIALSLVLIDRGGQLHRGGVTAISGTDALT